MNRRSSQQRGALLILVLVMALVIAACSGGDSSDTSSPDATGDGGSDTTVSSESTEPTESPSEGDDTEFVVSVGGLGGQTWDPANSDSGPSPVKGAIGETLLRVNPTTRELEPGIAESWEVSEDGLVVTFQLRDDVEFHDGWGNVTAEDVKFTIEQYLGETSDRGNQMQAIERAVDANPAENVEVLGPHELRITSPQHEVLLLRALANGSIANAMFIQSKAYWEDDPEFALENPLGAGPYQFVSSTPGVEVKLEAVEDHWRQTPYYKNVTFSIVPDDAARLQQVQSGAADIAVIPASLAREAQDSGVDLKSIQDYGIMSVVLGGFHEGSEVYTPDVPWIQADSPEQGLAIREALSLAIDREAILAAVLAEQGTQSAGPILNYPSIESRNDPSWELPAYDPDLAIEKLAEGGYPDGFTIEFPTYDNRPGIGQAAVGEAIIGYWEAIGIDVERNPITDEQSDDITRPDPPNMQGLAINRFDPFMDESFQTLACCYNENGTHKLMFDPVFDEALANLTSEPDPEVREQITKDLIVYLMETRKALPLFTVNWIVAQGDRVGSWDTTTAEGSVHALETVAP